MRPGGPLIHQTTSSTTSHSLFYRICPIDNRIMGSSMEYVHVFVFLKTFLGFYFIDIFNLNFFFVSAQHILNIMFV